MGAEIGVGALLSAAGISAFGNLAGSALSSAGANRTNEALMSFNSEEAAKNRQFQKDMYKQQLSDQEDMYNKYQSPEAIAKQLQSIGVNPASVLGQGKGMGNIPSVPSVASGSQASVGSLENPMAAYGQALKSTTSDAVSVLNAITDKNLKDKQALKVLAEKANIQTQTELLAWQDMINKTIGNEKARAELNNIVEQTAMYASTNQLNKAQSLVADTIKKLNNKEFDIKDEELSQLKVRGLYLVDSLKNQLNYQAEQIKTEKAKQSESYASAGASRAGASYTRALEKTENELRPYRKQIERANGYVAQSTAPNKIRESEQEIIKSKWFNEILKNKNLGVVLENKDKSLYNAFQRLVRGKSIDGDVSEFLRGLTELGDTQYIK